MRKLPDANLQCHGKQSITHLITSLSVCPSPTDVRVNLPYLCYSCPSPHGSLSQHNVIVKVYQYKSVLCHES